MKQLSAKSLEDKQWKCSRASACKLVFMVANVSVPVVYCALIFVTLQIFPPQEGAAAISADAKSTATPARERGGTRDTTATLRITAVPLR